MHRLLCKDCGLLFWPRLQLMHGNRRYTRSLFPESCRSVTVYHLRAVADCLHVAWGMIKEIHKLKLSMIYKRQDLTNLTHLGIEEFSTQKDHKYITIFVNLQTGQIIHAIEGRSCEAISPFLKNLLCALRICKSLLSA